jgi:dipeptidyl aminopeptidase/acylaminoacyl peptidase
LSSDGKTIVFFANAGSDKLDVDRRHLVRSAVDKAGIEVLTPGEGIETEPVVTGDGSMIAYFSATASRPSVLTVKPAAGGTATVVASTLIPSDLPARQMITPKQVIYKSSDGVTVHAQLFEEPGSGSGKKPAILFVHGGPSRQMLLGWHYMDYYTNCYALNQYLASRGFVVLSVNYRLGIGYGYDFQRPHDGGAAGASEYLDVKAGGEWLAHQPQVDTARIGIYGGSYGGFLTAMALAKDSKLFAAGVDIHGVHDWTQQGRLSTTTDRFEKIPDAEKALALAYKSSPIAWVSGWKSPVLFIHGDDDRNVRFNQSIDLIRRLDSMPVPLETLVIVDDTHHMMRHANQLKVDEAIAEFMERKLKLEKPAVSAAGAR